MHTVPEKKADTALKDKPMKDNTYIQQAKAICTMKKYNMQKITSYNDHINSKNESYVAITK